MEKREILIISNYYPPESGAAANRIQTLAHAMRDHGFDTQVVCPLPNYPTGQVFKEFKGKIRSKNLEDSITVNRLWLWPSKSENKFVRLFSMLSFAFSLSIFLLFTKTPKKVIIQYSPVFVGFAGVFWCWILGKRIILNVSDLWPLAGLEMGLLNKGTYYSLLEKMESFCYQKSDLILGQSEEILEHVKKNTVEKALFLYRNYPTFEPPHLNTMITQRPRIKIVYAGLVGVAQGLSKIFSQIKIPKNIEFHIYGDGPDMSSLENLKKTQITFHGSVTREILHRELQNYDVAFVPLMTRIYGSVPSKIFEYSRLGLPLLYMGGGEGGEVVLSNKIGWVIEVGNYNQLEEFLEQLDESSFEGMAKSQILQRALANFDFEHQFQALVKKL